ncbi:MAG: hypothetical protein HQM03_09655 [Magnetococcales bacterium]|nr:hypothetical protein [Magnetococcales bacterium]
MKHGNNKMQAESNTHPSDLQWLAYQAHSGILKVNFEYDKNKCKEKLRNFILSAIKLADIGCTETTAYSHNEYRILDSFFSDSFTKDDIILLINMAIKHKANLKFLLANPYSNFAKSRSGILYPRGHRTPDSETKE